MDDTKSQVVDVAAAYYEEHKSLLKPINETIAKGDSAIQKFYEGTSVFVTGSTGFLGKQLIEKLLRACKIKRIYVLIRPKKGIPINERLANFTKDVVYDELKKYQPNFAEKIVPIGGDIAEVGLGINEEDWITLTQEVNIIFHAAATTRFEEHIRTATLINIRGTREVLTLAKNCMNLKSFVYVSTAFSQGTLSKIGKEVLEEFYPCPVPSKTMIELVENVDVDKLKAITSELIHDWPNTYTFTKVISEETVRIMGKGLPVCIVRPPIVTPSYLEPVPGWTDLSNAFSSGGLMLGVVTGAIHVLISDDVHLDIVPVDYVNNTIIASAWDTAHRDREEVKIYTIHNETGYSWGLGSRFLRTPEFRRFASPKYIWYGFALEVSNKFFFWILTWFLHYIPGYIVDAACCLFSIKMPKEITSLVKLYDKAYKQCIIYSYYLFNEWQFSNRNTMSMYERLSQGDRVIFNFDTSTMDWKKMLTVWNLGVRLFVVKDGLKGTAYGVKKQRVCKILTYLFLGVYILVAWFMLSTVIKFFV